MTDHQRGTRVMAAKNRHIVSYKLLPSNKPAHQYASCMCGQSHYCMLLLTACPGNCLLHFPTAEDCPDLWTCCGDQLSGGLCSSGHYLL